VHANTGTPASLNLIDVAATCGIKAFKSSSTFARRLRADSSVEVIPLQNDAKTDFSPIRST
jgi:hypothetical protein